MGVVLVVVGAILIFFLLPLLLFVLELLALPFLLLAFGGPWVVEARNTQTGERVERRARGWRGGRRAARELTAAIAQYQPSPDHVRVLPNA